MGACAHLFNVCAQHTYRICTYIQMHMGMDTDMETDHDQYRTLREGVAFPLPMYQLI